MRRSTADDIKATRREDRADLPRAGSFGAHSQLSHGNPCPDLERQVQRPLGHCGQLDAEHGAELEPASVIINSATNNPVLIDISPTIANLTLGASDSLTL